MTVTTETNRTGPDVANGVTTVFSFTFPIQDQSHLKVTFADSAGAETVLTLATDYTVSIVGDAGSITLVDAAGLGAGTITMTRDIPFLQETDISNQGRLYLATAEGGFDLSVMRDQQLLEQLDRTLTIPVSAASGVSTEMPAPSANEIVGWNAAATALENKGSAPDVSTVSSIATEIVAVAGISSEIVAVAGIGSDITTAAANVTDIQNFADLYQISAAAPTQRADTTALQEGDLYYNTTTDDVWWYSGSAWLKVDTFDQSLNTTDSPAFAGLTVPSINGGPLYKLPYLINGNFDWWQRGTSFGLSVYNADRWFGSLGDYSAGTCSIEKGTLTVAEIDDRAIYFARINNTDATTGSSGHLGLEQRVEDPRILTGKQITISAWVRRSSGTQISIGYGISYGTGGSAGSGARELKTVSSNFSRVSATFTVPSSSGKTIGTAPYFAIYVWAVDKDNSLGDMAASETVDIAMVQVDDGDTVTEFEHVDFATELARCQRYYYASPAGEWASIFSGDVVSGNVYYVYVPLPTTMRATPTVAGTTVAGSRFPATVTIGAVTSRGFFEHRTANATGGGYFGSSYTADAEL